MGKASREKRERRIEELPNSSELAKMEGVTPYWNPSNVPIAKRPITRRISSAVLFAFFAFMFPGFLQTRGFVNITASRFFLYPLLLVLMLAWALFWASLRKRNRFLLWMVMLLLVASAGCADYFTLPPKITPTSTASRTDETRPPEPEKSKDDASGLEIADWRRKYDPNALTLHDLFITDIKGQLRGGAPVALDVQKKIVVEYAVVTEIYSNSKVMLFYVPNSQSTTKPTCMDLARQFRFLLEPPPNDLTLRFKFPGDSGEIATKDAAFTGRIYIYHETYLVPADVAEITRAFAKKGANVILRSVDYLSTQKMALQLANKASK